MSPPAPRENKDKFVVFDDLPRLAEEHRDQGKTIVLAHGVFDLMHLGHVRHFERARKEGGILVVSLTADKFVNKGPDRPVFEETIRAEMVSAIEYVDYVTINRDPSAMTVLNQLRPDIYVKGSDYENPEDDITGNITRERETVERHGGRMVLTHDITFSSSNIINRYLNVYDPPMREFLDTLHKNGGISTLMPYLDRALHRKIVLIGETIIDEYRFVRPLGKPSKENIIATQLMSSEIFAGGIIATARHMSSFVQHVEIITWLGYHNLESDRAFIEAFLPENVTLHVVVRKEGPTTRKIRYIDPSYTRKLFEVYDFINKKMTDDEIDETVRIYDKLRPDTDAVVANDFGHGMFAEKTIAHIIANAPFLAVNAQTNAGNQGFNYITRWPQANYVCIDEPEARLAVSDNHSSSIEIVKKLADQIKADQIIVTHGQYGSYSYSKDGHIPMRYPAFTNRVVDTVGAGDAFFAVSAALASDTTNTCPPELLSLVGNAAGAIKVGIIGHRDSVHRSQLIRFLTTLMK